VPGTELPSDAVHLGYVPTVDLPALYGAAAVVTYPSAYEGFGLPPIEAMASGAAVVATAVGALPEVAARGALLIPPGDPDAFASALGELLGDECRRQSLAAAGREAASALTWRSTAEGTVDVYRSLGVG
jgi:glycosyltransferase involved in cell wall biosynthesis